METFPHIVDRLCALWGSAEFDDYAGRLLTDSRDGQRQGFPPAVVAELLLLVQVNRLVRAIDLAKAKKIPLQEAIRLIDEEDASRQRAMGFEDPFAGSDAGRRERRIHASATPVSSQARRQPPASRGVFAGLTALFFSKTFWLLVVLLLSAKLLWPYLR